MTTGRRNLGFGSSDPIIFPTGKKSPEEIQLRKRAAETAAQDSGFPSREPMTAIDRTELPTQTPDRRKRTGRDKAFACRTTAEHVERFYKIVDGNKWGVGETFERALDALEREMRSH